MSRSIVVKPIPHISTPMLGVAVSLLLCCGLLPTSSNAALVTLQGNYLSYDHFDQSSGDYDGLFVFTYEDSTPDTNPNPDRGTYDNPIISAQITLSKPTKPDILLVLDPSSGTHIATDTIQRSINVNIEARFIESGSNILYDLAVRIETYTLPNDGLSSLIGMRREDSCASSLRRTDGGSSQFFRVL